MRQREVGRLLRAGKTYSEISRLLGCEKSTVRSHVENLYRRLDITSRWELLDLPRRIFAVPVGELPSA